MAHSRGVDLIPFEMHIDDDQHTMILELDSLQAILQVKLFYKHYHQVLSSSSSSAQR